MGTTTGAVHPAASHPQVLLHTLASLVLSCREDLFCPFHHTSFSLSRLAKLTICTLLLTAPLPTDTEGCQSPGRGAFQLCYEAYDLRSMLSEHERFVNYDPYDPFDECGQGNGCR